MQTRKVHTLPPCTPNALFLHPKHSVREAGGSAARRTGWKGQFETCTQHSEECLKTVSLSARHTAAKSA